MIIFPNNIQVIIFSVLIGFGFGFFWVWATKPLERRGWGHFNKFHVHHTVLGLLFSVLGIFAKDARFIFFGLGMIIHHFITEGPQFITKD